MAIIIAIIIIINDLRKQHGSSIVWEKKGEKAWVVHIFHMKIELEKLKKKIPSNCEE